MKLETKQKAILAMIFASSVAIIGCGQPSNDSNISTTTSVSTIIPTGTIQGVLIDAVTQQPIAGAVIDIGLSTSTTNQDGQFVIANVPATNIGTGAAAGTTLTGTYQVSINLKDVTKPVNMADTTITKRYPDYSFKTAQVFYTSDVGHPLTGVASGYQFMVGKQAATIAGVVTDANGNPAPAGYNVTLYSAINSQNSATGGTGQGPVVNAGSNSGHIVTTTTTNASGNFTFANIEAGVPIVITAQDTATTLYGERAITAPTENATRTLSFQNGDAVVVASTDTISPKVVSVTPENNSDITPAATSVVFTFSEPIKQTSVVKDVSPSNPNGLYSLVDVNFTGPKPLASNLAHTLAWSTDRKTLTVTLPAVGASSMYTVDLTRAASTLKDDADNPVVTPASLAAAELAKLAVAFTTNGGATAAAPAIAMTNSTSINATSLTTGVPVKATLEWLPVSGAKGYNVYRTMKQVWGTTIVTHQTELINTIVGTARPVLKTSNLTDTFFVLNPLTGLDTATPLDYVENNSVKLTYSYFVKSVNSDGIESTASNTVDASDVVAPSIVAGGAVVCLAAATCDATGKITAIFVPFDEVMDEATVNTVANYTSAVAAFSSAAYNANGATLTLTTPIATTAVPYGYITTGTNGINNTTVSALDIAVIPFGQGTPNSVCVTAAALGTNPTAAPVGDDMLVTQTATTKGYIHSGPNGVCNTTFAGTDVQTIPVNTGTPNTVAITAGANGVVNSTFVGDDVLIPAGVVVTVAGVKDVAGKLIGAASGAGKTKYNADGTVN